MKGRVIDSAAEIDELLDFVQNEYLQQAITMVSISGNFDELFVESFWKGFKQALDELRAGYAGRLHEEGPHIGWLMPKCSRRSS